MELLALPHPATDVRGTKLAPHGCPFATFVARLHDAAERIEAKDPQAAPRLRQLLDDIRAAADPRCVGLYVFGAALARLLSGAAVEQANLYLNRFEVPQIDLFNLLGRAVPFVGLATTMANNALARALRGQDEAVVIDVGIGTGRQMALLIEALAARGEMPQRLTIIGIEPADWALASARHTIEATAVRFHASVRFVPVLGTAEALDAQAWQHIRAVCDSCTTPPLINASFALHHIADDADGADQRDAVLRALRSLEPALVLLSEPDVDHREPGLAQRFANCWAHFGAVFRTLDLLPLAQAERDALKVGFFGREIADILGTPEAQRSERHESARSWLGRLAASAFEARLDAAERLPTPAAGGVRVTGRGRYATIDAGDEPVVAVIVAVPV